MVVICGEIDTKGNNLEWIFLKINCKYRQEESLKQINCVGGINNGEQCFVIGNNGEHGLAQMKPCQSLHIGVESTKSSL